MADVFVSYIRYDRKIAHQFGTGLEREDTDPQALRDHYRLMQNSHDGNFPRSLRELALATLRGTSNGRSTDYDDYWELRVSLLKKWPA